MKRIFNIFLRPEFFSLFFGCLFGFYIHENNEITIESGPTAIGCLFGLLVGLYIKELKRDTTIRNRF